ncbi:MAG: PAS domain-containing sensor histidine kinase [Bacteroidetes bacterium]|nr:MAG: PAS domain-containing sensor histidine kinase [Bacteroidota bacterium]
MHRDDRNEILKALDRERKARKLAESIIEEKSLRLYEKNLELENSYKAQEELIERREEWLKQRENELNTVYNEHPLPIIIYDLETLQILDVNQTAIDFYGYTKKELIERRISELHTQEELKILDAHIEKIRNSEYSVKHWHHVTKNGAIKTLKITGRSVHFGNRLARMALIEDITGIDQLKKEKENALKKYQLIVEKSSDIVFRINAEGYFIYVNPEGCKAIEYSPDELYQIRFDQLVCLNYIEEVVSKYQEQIRNRIQHTYLEFPVITKSGKKIWIGQSVDIAEVQDGEVTELIAFAREITEKKRSEELLQRSEEKFRSIIENMELGIVEVDAHGTIIKAYPSFCKIVGYDPEELEGTKGLFLINEEGKKRMLKEQEDRIEGKTNVYEFELITKSGEHKWVMISGAPILDENRKVTGSIGIHLDITDQKRLQNELKEAKEVAEDSLKSKELFLANISHEIRTPLNAISGLLQLLSQSELSIKQAEYITHIETATENLLTLIQDLLLLSKSQLGEIELNNESHSLYTVMSNTFSLFTNSVKNDINYTASLAINPEQYYLFDKLRFSQILQNLISNALKFTDSGEVKLIARVIQSNPDLDTIEIRVRDTGIGIPEKDLPRIYEDFKQASNNDVTINGGTGLGLSIVRNLIKLMNGDIQIESNSTGTEVKIQLTLEKSISSKRYNSSLQENTFSNSIKNILVAEDNVVNQFLISNFLNELGHSYTIVSNGKEVLDQIKHSDYDLILMDVRMPLMDGITATAHIRKSCSKEVLPIVGLTADDVELNHNHYILSGMNAVLSKPIDLKKLTEEIQKYNRVNGEITDLQRRIEKSIGNNEDLQRSLLTIFIEDTTIRIEELEHALKNENTLQIKDLLHAMKPSLNHLGREDLTNNLREFEKDLLDETFKVPEFQKFIKKLNNLVADCVHLLSKFETEKD